MVSLLARVFARTWGRRSSIIAAFWSPYIVLLLVPVSCRTHQEICVWTDRSCCQLMFAQGAVEREGTFIFPVYPVMLNDYGIHMWRKPPVYEATCQGLIPRARRVCVSLAQSRPSGFIHNLPLDNHTIVDRPFWWDEFVPTVPMLWITIPLWPPLTTLTIGLLIYWIGRDLRQSRRVRVGHCRQCNYDLRGSGGAFCPECGSVISASSPIAGRAT